MGGDGDRRPHTDDAETGSSDAASSRPTTDDLFRALASTPRRRVLAALLGTPRRSCDELVDLLAGWRATARDEPVGPAERARIRGRLHHVDLPVLVECGLVTVDDEAVELVALDESTRELLGDATELG